MGRLIRKNSQLTKSRMLSKKRMNFIMTDLLMKMYMEIKEVAITKPNLEN